MKETFTIYRDGSTLTMFNEHGKELTMTQTRNALEGLLTLAEFFQ